MNNYSSIHNELKNPISKYSRKHIHGKEILNFSASFENQLDPEILELQAEY